MKCKYIIKKDVLESFQVYNKRKSERYGLKTSFSEESSTEINKLYAINVRKNKIKEMKSQIPFNVEKRHSADEIMTVTVGTSMSNTNLCQQNFECEITPFETLKEIGSILKEIEKPSYNSIINHYSSKSSRNLFLKGEHLQKSCATLKKNLQLLDPIYDWDKALRYARNTYEYLQKDFRPTSLNKWLQCFLAIHFNRKAETPFNNVLQRLLQNKTANLKILTQQALKAEESSNPNANTVI
uniref:Uncharacterized protein n=1 Tax=Dugesia ryukyuensis TaxID=79738 RepID=A7M6E1_DUGRY|nr:hypothetical protein [Dugesia ryukyuensis]